MRFLIFLPLMLMNTAGSGVGGGAGTGTGAGQGSSQGSGQGQQHQQQSGQQSSQGSQSSSVTSGVDTGQGRGSGSDQSPSGQGQGQGQQQSDPNVNDPAYGNWKELRTQRDQYRTQAAEHAAQLETWNRISTEASQTALELGYTAEDFATAFKQNPTRTLQILAQEQAQRQSQRGQGRQQQGQQDGQPDLEELVRSRVDSATKPVTEFVNQQMTEAAMTKYETSLTENITADPVLKGAPPEVHEIVKDYLGEYFASQPDILLGFKQKGDFTPVKEAVTYIAGRLQTAFTAWLNKNNSTGGFQGRQQGAGQGQQGVQRPNGKVSLDDIINDPSVLGEQYRG